jgi:uncharacterized protein (TIGR02172 family)
MKDISLDKPLAHGRTADVYDWDDGHVLKLFHNWFDLDSIEYELKMARAVHASGVKSPAAGEQIEVQGRNGLIYERVAGESMLTLLLRKPWMVFSYSKILAQLHVQMHGCTFEADIPTQRARLQRKTNSADALSSSLKASLLKALDALPDGDRVCHGDFHPGNVLMAKDDATIIDWIDASRGNPLADVARTSIILLGAAETSQISNSFIKGLLKISHTLYLREYFHLQPGGEEEYRGWLPIVAGARLNENIREVEEWLLKQVNGSIT